MWPFRNLAEFCNVAESLFDHYAVPEAPCLLSGTSPSSSAITEVDSHVMHREMETPSHNDADRYVTSFEVSLAMEVLFGFVPTAEEVRDAIDAAAAPQSASTGVQHQRRLNKDQFLDCMRSRSMSLAVVPHPSTALPWQDAMWTTVLDPSGRGYLTAKDVLVLQRALESSPVAVTSVGPAEVAQAVRTLEALDDAGDGRVSGCDVRNALVAYAAKSVSSVGPIG